VVSDQIGFVGTQTPDKSKARSAAAAAKKLRRVRFNMIGRTARTGDRTADGSG